MQLQMYAGLFVLALSIQTCQSETYNSVIRLVKYENEEGIGANGQCCDGKYGVCQSNGCDHMFAIIITSNPIRSSPSETSIQVLQYDSLAIENADTVVFGDDIGGVENPMYLNGHRGFTMEVRVDDKDGWNDNDFVDVLYLNMTVLDLKATLHEGGQDIVITNRTRLEINIQSDPCSPNPCQNGGSCNAGSCTCPTGYCGETCASSARVMHSCPPGWILGNGNRGCYYERRYLVNFVTANSFCDNIKGGWPDNGHLVVINDAAENSYVQQLIASHGFEWCWIGLHDMYSEGRYEWVDGQASSYTNYKPGEPNNNRGREDCTYMDQDSGRWNDTPCSATPSLCCETTVRITMEC